MRFDPPSVPTWGDRLPDFLLLVGEDRWWRRAEQLLKEANRSPYRAKIVEDAHWLEMELSHQLVFLRERGMLDSQDMGFRSRAALLFAATVVEVHRRLSRAGQVSLIGRLRDGLNSGFAGLYLEMDTAHGLLADGFEVAFPDFEGEAQYDLQFSRGTVCGEVECKSLSADAGRKIHRRDFYRFIDALAPDTFQNKSIQHPVLIIVLNDRLATDDARQRELCEAATRAFARPGDIVTNALGSIRCEAMPVPLFERLSASPADGYAACREAYGDNCHVAGAFIEEGGCIVVMRSLRVDDHSKPQIQAIKDAAAQLSSAHPGIVAIQYEDIVTSDLTRPHVRRRAALLANSLFHDPRGKYSHIAAVYHCAFGGFYNYANVIVRPAFVGWNPNWKGSVHGMPFRDTIPNSEFAKLLGVDPSATDPDDFQYGVGL